MKHFIFISFILIQATWPIEHTHRKATRNTLQKERRNIQEYNGMHSATLTEHNI